MSGIDAVSALRGDWLFPTQIRFGCGRIAELGEVCRRLGLKRPLIVTDRGLIKTDVARTVIAAASLPGVAPQVYAEVRENPTNVEVEAGAAAFHAAQCDGVIALGGGSALDCGKAIAVLAGCGGSLWRFAWPDHEAAQLETGVHPIIAVPTTAGTGAEVEASGIITDPRIPIKKGIVHPMMMPKVVVADPALTASLPPHLTAATGMDALSHNLEALCVAGYHPMADAIALAGIVAVARYLPVAVREPGNLEARSQMMAAALMGATAFGKGLGAMHALSHVIGAMINSQHGLTNAVLMPFVLTHNRAAIADKMAMIAEALKLGGDPFTAVHRWILDLRREVGVPHTVTELGLARADFDRVAALAETDICAGTNPVPIAAAGFRAILDAAA
ncbi:MAG TPA: iron-containing alcohol dehydrogenase [Dongiaceae bacterium]|jgi:alcohol dehydrogenase class IV|nr:iron-containing alcohol dehydrogenase [Dongiaceae bacterium]